MHWMHVVLAVSALAGCTGAVDGEAPRQVEDDLVIGQGGSCVAVEQPPRVEIRYRAPAVPRAPRRALLMLTGALASASSYDAPVAGFNCLDRAAAAGYDAYALSYEGTGASSYPDDGTTLDRSRMLVDAAAALESIHAATGARVDLFGSSVGSLLAMQLGSDGSPVGLDDVGGLVLTGVVYGAPPALALPPLFDAVDWGCIMPGYVTTTAADYDPLLGNAAPEVAAWARAALPGVYALGPLLAIGDLAAFDATRARAPALQIWGDRDPITDAADVSFFQWAYAGPIELHVVRGGGHVPYYEPGADDAWSAIFGFLDRVHAADGARCASGGTNGGG